MANPFGQKFFQYLIFAGTLGVWSCGSHHEQHTNSSGDSLKSDIVVNNPEYEAGKIYPSIFGNDGSQSYALYLPTGYDKTRKYPVIIFMDPHADGSLPLNNYKTLADRFGVVLAGSNDSKNGLAFDAAVNVVNKLLTELISRYSIDPKQITLAGFSGGAKVALIAASTHPELNSVIYCGAALPPASITGLPPALGFAGIRDMNYTEVLGFSKSMDTTKFRHAVVEWEGKHEWPDSMTFQYAFYWAGFVHFSQIPGEKPASLPAFLAMQKKKSSGGNVLQRVNILEQNIAFLTGFADTKAYSDESVHLKKSGEFYLAMKEESRLTEQENQFKQNFLQAFGSATIDWWNFETKRLRENKKDAMSQRLLAYISLASYSLSNRALHSNDMETLRQTLRVYKLADPENSEQPFLTACMYAKLNQPDSALYSLKEAIGLGLKDRQKLESEESFTQMKNSVEFHQMLDSMKR